MLHVTWHMLHLTYMTHVNMVSIISCFTSLIWLMLSTWPAHVAWPVLLLIKTINVCCSVLCYLYLTQHSLYLPLYGEEAAGEELHAPVLITDHKELSPLTSRREHPSLSLSWLLLLWQCEWDDSGFSEGKSRILLKINGYQKSTDPQGFWRWKTFGKNKIKKWLVKQLEALEI